MSQTAKLLDVLRAARGEWVSMTTAGREIGAWAVHSRAADLRRQGHAIENRIEVAEDGQRHSYYRLIEVGQPEGATPVSAGQSNCAQPQPIPAHPVPPAAASDHSRPAAVGAPAELGLVFDTDGSGTL